MELKRRDGSEEASLLLTWLGSEAGGWAWGKSLGCQVQGPRMSRSRFSGDL